MDIQEFRELIKRKRDFNETKAQMAFDGNDIVGYQAWSHAAEAYQSVLWLMDNRLDG